MPKGGQVPSWTAAIMREAQRRESWREDGWMQQHLNKGRCMSKYVPNDVEHINGTREMGRLERVGDTGRSSHRLRRCVQSGEWAGLRPMRQRHDGWTDQVVTHNTVCGWGDWSGRDSQHCVQLGELVGLQLTPLCAVRWIGQIVIHTLRAIRWIGWVTTCKSACGQVDWSHCELGHCM